MLGLKLNHVSKSGPRWLLSETRLKLKFLKIRKKWMTKIDITDGRDFARFPYEFRMDFDWGWIVSFCYNILLLSMLCRKSLKQYCVCFYQSRIHLTCDVSSYLADSDNSHVQTTRWSMFLHNTTVLLGPGISKDDMGWRANAALVPSGFEACWTGIRDCTPVVPSD